MAYILLFISSHHIICYVLLSIIRTIESVTQLQQRAAKPAQPLGTLTGKESGSPAASPIEKISFPSTGDGDFESATSKNGISGSDTELENIAVEDDETEKEERNSNLDDTTAAGGKNFNEIMKTESLDTFNNNNSSEPVVVPPLTVNR